MISGAGELRITEYTPITGLGVFIPVAVNPTNEEYTEITGREMPYPLTYDMYDTQVGENTVTARPISILGYNPEMKIFESLKFTLIDTPVTSSSGKTRFVNKIGQFSYYAANADEIRNNPKVTQWYNTEMLTPLRIGEESYYTFIQKLIKYNSSSSEAQFVVDIKNIGADFDTLYSGNVDGLKKLLDWAKGNQGAVGVLYSVREKVKETDEGTKVYNIQNIENNPNLFYLTSAEADGTITLSKSAHTRFSKYIKEREDAGYPAVKNYYTTNLVKYNKEKCDNYVPAPEDVISKPDSSSGISTW